MNCKAPVQALPHADTHTHIERVPLLLSDKTDLPPAPTSTLGIDVLLLHPNHPWGLIELKIIGSSGGPLGTPHSRGPPKLKPFPDVPLSTFFRMPDLLDTVDLLREILFPSSVRRRK